MRGLLLAILALSLASPISLAESSAGPVRGGSRTPLPPLVTGLENPESVCIGPDGRIYVSVIGKFDKEGDGSIVVLQDGKAIPFATGLDDPKGLVAHGNFLYVADRTRVWRIDQKGKAEVYVDASAFPRQPLFLNDIEVSLFNPTDPQSANVVPVLFVSDSGDLKGKGGAVYRIDPKRKVSLFLDSVKGARLNTPNGLRVASEYHLHFADFGTGELFLVRLADGKMTKLADGFGGADGITYDHFGRLYISDWKNGKVFVIGRPGDKPVVLAEGFGNAADICLSKDGKSILVPDMKAGTLTAVPIGVPGAEVSTDPLPVTIEPAFADLEWTGWKGETEAGKIVPFRPILLTHAGDGSNRLFVPTQQGVVHVFPNDPTVKKTKIFLDIQDRVSYKDSENEEGFLGLAFPPSYKKTGDFYVFYTPKNRKLTNFLSRFRVSKDDPDRADPTSEEVLLEMPKPFWNHNAGTLCFGKDGYLYIATGDGGAANDPFNNAQNLNSLLGKILRLDISRKEAGKNYAIPKDNPFVGHKDKRGEIWAYGLRNVWRMSFDRVTGQLWAADVGQNLWEEINLIEKGGNYGWRPREGLHPFGRDGVLPNEGMIEPIWEYHHDIGKSITGGFVYRGDQVKALQGKYVYADYVSGHVWALHYDEGKKRVIGNHLLREGGFPVFSFGEDEKGEVYLLTSTPNGKGLFRFANAR